MISVAHANHTIPSAEGKVNNYKLDYNTKDIISQVLWGDAWLRKHRIMADFAASIAPTYAGMEEMYDFLYQNIHYVADGRFFQWVKSPAVLWAEKEGDCKSFSTFIIGVLQELNLDYIIRFTSYKRGKKKPTHVYVIAILPDGQQVIIDPVWGLEGGGTFNTEKPYRHKTDYHMRPERGLAFISGTAPDSNTVVQAVEDILQNIPESIMDDGDITEMTEGEAQRYFMARRLESQADNADPATRTKLRVSASVIRKGATANIGALAPDQSGPVMRFLQDTERLKSAAFVAPTLRISQADKEALDGFFKNVWNGIKKGAKAVAKVTTAPVRAAWKLLMNWIFKGPMQKAGPFFLFTFLKRNPGGAVGKRIASQNKVKDFMVKLGVSRSTMDASIKSGIVENTGSSPEQLLNTAAKGQVAGIGVVATVIATIIKAVGWIIQIVGKISKLFKKDQPSIQEGDTSDLNVLEDQMAPPEKQHSKPGASSNSSGSGEGSGGGGLAIAAGLAAAVLAFT